ncbi:hypothetical protein C1H46_045588 [Malus baccata]|uniref:Uncharacterized protein n=1 Tax=Malus baccata TaxID=106549 RepID=A0A540K3R6_MALBA|nr:hypothetical protein C1H46_045588 [Malus baccata]
MGIDPVTHSPRLDLLDFSSILYNSSHHHHQMNNFSRLLGQPTGLNPELLRLATSLIQSRRENNSNQNFALQNAQENDYHQICNPQIQPQQPVQDNVPYPNEVSQLMQQQPNVEYPSSLSDFRSQNSQVNEWQSNVGTSNFTEEYVELPSFAYFGSEQHQTALDLSPETSNFHSNNSNQNFSFTSVFSTPSSSPTTLNSNSTTYFNSGTEDERESYCSNMLKFGIPDILGVNEFM